MNPALIRIKRRLANLNDRYENTPELAHLATDQDEYEAKLERRASELNARCNEQIVIDALPDESLDGGRMTCLVCGLSSDHESMGAASASGWSHAQECGEQR